MNKSMVQRMIGDMRRRAADRLLIESGGMPETVRIAACAAFERAGFSPDAIFGERIANMAADTFRHGGNIAALCGFILDCEGLPFPPNTYEAIQAAGSTATGAALFQGIVEVALQQPFESSKDTTQGWVEPREVQNFKTNNRPRLQHGERLERIPRGHSAPHTAIRPNDAESYSAMRYAKQFEVSEQDLVDDDTSALINPTLALSMASRDLKLDLCYLQLLANGNMQDGTALFASGHGNLNTSASLSEANLDAAIATMETQTENTRPIDAEPGYLLCPPALKGLARRLVRGMNTGDGNDIEVRSEPRLSQGITSPIDGTANSGSATTWYLASKTGPRLEMGYVDSAIPQARITPLGLGRWGLNVSVKYDIGVKALAWEGLQQNTA